MLDGDAVGGELGAAVGAPDGMLEGDADGAVVTVMEGTADGAADGDAEGIEELGTAVGISLA